MSSFLSVLTGDVLNLDDRTHHLHAVKEAAIPRLDNGLEMLLPEGHQIW